MTEESGHSEARGRGPHDTLRKGGSVKKRTDVGLSFFFFFLHIVHLPFGGRGEHTPIFLDT